MSAILFRHNVYPSGAFRCRWTGIYIGRHAGELFGDGPSWAGLVDFYGVVFCRYGYWQWVLDYRNLILSLYINRSIFLTLQIKQHYCPPLDKRDLLLMLSGLPLLLSMLVPMPESDIPLPIGPASSSIKSSSSSSASPTATSLSGGRGVSSSFTCGDEYRSGGCPLKVGNVCGVSDMSECSSCSLLIGTESSAASFFTPVEVLLSGKTKIVSTSQMMPAKVISTVQNMLVRTTKDIMR